MSLLFMNYHWFVPLFNTKGSFVRLPCGISGIRSFGLHKADMFHGHRERSYSSDGPNRQDTWSVKDFDRLHSQWQHWCSIENAIDKLLKVNNKYAILSITDYWHSITQRLSIYSKTLLLFFKTYIFTSHWSKVLGLFMTQKLCFLLLLSAFCSWCFLFLFFFSFLRYDLQLRQPSSRLIPNFHYHHLNLQN